MNMNMRINAMILVLQILMLSKELSCALTQQAANLSVGIYMNNNVFLHVLEDPLSIQTCGVSQLAQQISFLIKWIILALIQQPVIHITGMCMNNNVLMHVLQAPLSIYQTSAYQLVQKISLLSKEIILA